MDEAAREPYGSGEELAQPCGIAGPVPEEADGGAAGERGAGDEPAGEQVGGAAAPGGAPRQAGDGSDAAVTARDWQAAVDRAEDPLTRQVLQMAGDMEGRIIAERRYLHARPELSLVEYATQRFICEKLEEEGIPFVKMAGTGVVGTIKGEAPGAYNDKGRPAYRLAMRADIDALPIKECNKVDYASRYDGVMHACGHDCHVAMMLGAARILNRLRGHLRGEIRLIFQPAEEVTQGSKKMIRCGALEDVDSIFGQHIWSEVKAGTISCPPGQRMAATDWFRVDISGQSAHGSMPHKGVDAVVVAAELIVALQVLVSREVSPFEPTVVTIGEVHGGTVGNIVAGSAYLVGTTRTWTKRSRQEMPEHFDKICSRIASGLGAKAVVTWKPGHAGLCNDAACAARAQASAGKLFGEGALSDYEGTLAGEDFSEYLEHVPGVFAFLGTCNDRIGAWHPQHSCYYTVDESVLKCGAAFAAQYALDCLA